MSRGWDRATRSRASLQQRHPGRPSGSLVERLYFRTGPLLVPIPAGLFFCLMIQYVQSTRVGGRIGHEIYLAIRNVDGGFLAARRYFYENRLGATGGHARGHYGLSE